MASTVGRAAEAGVKVSFGMMNMEVNLYTGELTAGKNSVKMRNCCPTCYEKNKEAVGLGMRFYCPDDHGPFDNSTALKASENEDGTFSIVGNSDEVKEQKSEVVLLEKKQMELEFLMASDVLGNFFLADKVWVVQPTGKEAFFTVLLDMMDQDGMIHGVDGGARIGVGTIRIRDTEHVVRLSRWFDQMVLVKLLRPEDCKTFPSPIAADVSEKNVKMIQTLISLETVEFDPERFSDQSRARLLAWKKARETGVTVDVPKPKAQAKDQNDALSAMLEAAVEAAKAKAS